MKKNSCVKETLFIFLLIPIVFSCIDPPIRAKVSENPRTFCNPVNLNYRFMKIKEGAGIREAADPVIIEYQDKYYLFASKSSGYWYTEDFQNWTHVFIPDSVLPIEDYAPGNFVHNDYIYYVGSTHGKGMLYRSNDPDAGKWEKVKEIWSFWDPAFYVEGDNLYMYHGCSPTDPILVQVLDLNTLEEKTERIECFNSNKDMYGWERTGETNELSRRPYIEGAWMTAHNGEYYLQYAAPGTEWKSYADGVYVSESPTGPFRYMENSPVSYKPTGFIGGAGHGCLFTVGKGNYWKAATNSISVRHMFERRISLFPAGIDSDGYMFTNTYLGDYPMYLPSHKGNDCNNRPDWMLLSYNKPVAVSSERGGFPAGNAVDENVRTSWVASTNNIGECLELDLVVPSFIHAIQVNFDEEGASLSGYSSEVYQSYVISASHDGKKWYPVVDKETERTDTPHDYIEFEEAFKARYIRIENKGYTVAPYFSLRDFRIFGKGTGKKPGEVIDCIIYRDKDDPCKVTLTWKETSGSEGYIVRYGISKDKLYNNFQVFGDTKLDINSLNSGITYYFTVDSYNENGITPGQKIMECE
ncbi:family 43 glycosylhydrolase [uncultured Proteiniphilum sp.]|jgi:hypothetical protein|uniref:family 43 glycosylhydrolase n=1 Tax=uncultured Proteiniphilum sp. TaxID=497637 RepID=UPI00261E3F7F|nr:family 43 glycosylhydrolase [uncultured Proteiniphilum sp.]